MGRNDLCFCGSGKKIKNCHDNINSESVVARLAKANTAIDKAINSYYENNPTKPPCYKGCINCCYDYFEISSSEYALILVHLLKWGQNDISDLLERVKESMADFKISQPDMFEELERRKNKTSDNKPRRNMNRTNSPCPCLHPTEKMCMIYENRPIICRIFGSILPAYDSEKFNHWITCEHIGKRIDSRHWQPDTKILDHIQELKTKSKTSLQERFNLIEFDKEDKSIFEKGFPIFYALSIDLDEDKNIYNIIGKYKHLLNMSESEFKDWYFNKFVQ